MEVCPHLLVDPPLLGIPPSSKILIPPFRDIFPPKIAMKSVTYVIATAKIIFLVPADFLRILSPASFFSTGNLLPSRRIENSQENDFKRIGMRFDETATGKYPTHKKYPACGKISHLRENRLQPGPNTAHRTPVSKLIFAIHNLKTFTYQSD